MNYAAAVHYFPKINHQRAIKLFAAFSNYKEIWEAELPELTNAGIEASIADEFITWRQNFSIEKLSENLARSEIKTVTLNEDDYPKLLKEINDPPPVIFYRGELPKNKPMIGVVGTRKFTPYGKQVTKDFCSGLAKSGAVVVSGLALGVDGFAHESALENNAITVAVLGSGVDKHHVYPVAHQPLSERIIKNGGAILSEYPPNFKATPYSFPARNRIIAGLTRGTLVTEAPAKSGALITAFRCLDYNREIFVVPHPVSSKQGEGCNMLIKKGAQMVTSFEEILDSLQIQMVCEAIAPKFKPATKEEESIYKVLNKEPQHIDALVRKTSLPSNIILSKLAILELKGIVRNLGGMQYVLR